MHTHNCKPVCPPLYRCTHTHTNNYCSGWVIYVCVYVCLCLYCYLIWSPLPNIIHTLETKRYKAVKNKTIDSKWSCFW